MEQEFPFVFCCFPISIRINASVGNNTVYVGMVFQQLRLGVQYCDHPHFCHHFPFGIFGKVINGFPCRFHQQAVQQRFVEPE